MSNEFTPGPWYMGKPVFGQYHIYSDYTVDKKSCVAGKQAICTAPYEGKKGTIAYHEMFKANAALIAAAPELLAALEQIERLSLEADGTLVDVRAVLGDIARAAIAKAVGHE